MPGVVRHSQYHVPIHSRHASARDNHNQVKVASTVEISDMAVLRDEYRDHGDVVFLSMKDVYEDLAPET